MSDILYNHIRIINELDSIIYILSELKKNILESSDKNYIMVIISYKKTMFNKRGGFYTNLEGKI